MKQKTQWVEILLLFCLLAGFCVLNDRAADSVRHGLTVCGMGLIPAVFPVTVITLMLSGILHRFKSTKTGLWFLFLLAQCGGYTVGVLLLNELIKGGRLNDRQASRLLPCLINPGIGLMLGPVCRAVKLVGWLNWCAMALLNGVWFYFSKPTTLPIARPVDRPLIDLSTALVKSLSVVETQCGFVLFFSMINGIVSGFMPERYASVMVGLLEVTGGLYRNNNLYVRCFLAQFGGFCVLEQIRHLADAPFNPCYLWLGKGLLAGFTTALLKGLLHWFPVALPTAVSAYQGTNGFMIGYWIVLLFAIFVFLMSIGEKRVEIRRRICYNQKRKRGIL